MKKILAIFLSLIIALGISGCGDNMNKIEKAVDYIINNKNNISCTESELTQKSYQRLKKMASDKRQTKYTKAKMDDKHIAIRNMLEENE